MKRDSKESMVLGCLDGFIYIYTHSQDMIRKYWYWILKVFKSRDVCTAEQLIQWSKGVEIKSMSQLAGTVEYTDCISVEGYDSPRVSWIWHKAIWWWGSSNAGALGNAEYPFIAIAPKSTLAQSGSIW